MHYHVINEAMETEKERNIIDEDKERAVWLFDNYMLAAANCHLEVQAVSRFEWKVRNPVTKEFMRVALTECKENHEEVVV